MIVLADKTILLLFGLLAQLGERLPCKQEVRSSILLGSTKLRWLCQSSSGIDTETKRMDGYAAVARYSIVFIFGLVAQLGERRPVTPKAAGSKPVKTAIIGS